MATLTKTKTPPAKKRTPADYGAEPFDKAKGDAAILLDAIKTELADADFFTREDLLHLECFSHVATITRYEKVRLAVRYLLRYNELVALTRTDLALPAKSRFYADRTALADHFGSTVTRLLKKLRPGSEFSVMDVVDAWETDVHLTLNVKRVLTRVILQRMARDGLVASSGEYLYALRS